MYIVHFLYLILLPTYKYDWWKKEWISEPTYVSVEKRRIGFGTRIAQSRGIIVMRSSDPISSSSWHPYLYVTDRELRSLFCTSHQRRRLYRKYNYNHGENVVQSKPRVLANGNLWNVPTDLKVWFMPRLRLLEYRGTNSPPILACTVNRSVSALRYHRSRASTTISLITKLNDNGDQLDDYWDILQQYCGGKLYWLDGVCACVHIGTPYFFSSWLIAFGFHH